MTPPAPSPEHFWLHRLLGDWTCVHEALPGDGGDGHDHEAGTESWRKLGELWVLGEGRGEHGDYLFTLGHTAGLGAFTGSFITSMMDHFWSYEGQLEGPDKLVLHSRGPNMGEGGGLANFRDEIEFVSPSVRYLRGFAEQPDGSWQLFMQARYTRA